jgi:hypothetical protein
MNVILRMTIPLSTVPFSPNWSALESTMPKSHPPWAAEFRRQVIEPVRAGRTPAALSREFG